MSLQAQELVVCHSHVVFSACHSPHVNRSTLNATYRTIDYERDKDAIKTEALSFFANWSGGNYGSKSGTDIFIVCPRVTAMTPFVSEGVVGTPTPVIPDLAEVHNIPITVLHIIPVPRWDVHRINEFLVPGDKSREIAHSLGSPGATSRRV